MAEKLRGERARRKPDPRDGEDAARAYLVAERGGVEAWRLINHAEEMEDRKNTIRESLDPDRVKLMQFDLKVRYGVPLPGRGRPAQSVGFFAGRLVAWSEQNTSRRLGAIELMAVAIASGVEKARPDSRVWRDSVEEKWIRLHQRKRPS
jgi:hypothetical protein